jgi:hypothetical protein
MQVCWLILSSFMVSQTSGDSSSLDPHWSPTPCSPFRPSLPLFSHQRGDRCFPIGVWRHHPNGQHPFTCSHRAGAQRSNFSNWRMFFDFALGKFGLNTHVSASTPVLDCDANWYKVNQCIWIYTTCSLEILRIVHQRSKTDAFTLWTVIINLFHATSSNATSSTRLNSTTSTKVICQSLITVPS